MKVLVIGANNSGKGTLVKKLAERTCLRTIGCSSVLNEKGLDIATGRLLPDNPVNRIMKDTVEGDMFILDGYPRTLTQNAYMLENMFEPDLVVALNVSEAEVLRRAVGRRICVDCGETYNLNGFRLPKNEGVCDSCNGKLMQRQDDTEEVVKRRYAEYVEHTEPIIKYYKYGNYNTIVWEFNAEDNMDDIVKKISEYINN